MATPIVLKKPLRVYKVGKLATLGIFISQYQNFRYYKSQIMPTVKIRPKFERYSSVMGCVGELWVRNLYLKQSLTKLYIAGETIMVLANA